MKHMISIATLAFLACAAATPAAAQSYGGTGQSADGDEEAGSISRREAPRGRTSIDPYIEASQIFTQQLSPFDDFVTYSQLAVGVDASINGRTAGGTVSLRYERNFAWDDDAADTDQLTGVARVYKELVPHTLQIEAGALASRSRIDSGGGSSIVPIVGDDDAVTNTYAIYGGPSLSTRVDDAQIDANYRIGYTKVDGPDGITLDGQPYDVFDESLSHSATVRAAVAQGQPLPVGVGVGAGFYQEDVQNLDQRVRDVYARGDITVPISPTLAIIAGAGIEDVEVSSRDALRDDEGNPIIGTDGRYVVDPSSDRVIAYQADGLIWDVGVSWRPSSRTQLQASFGRRYDSDTFYGSFSWKPSSRSALGINVYDGIQGFGGRITNGLAALPDDFDVIRDPITGDVTGCTSLVDGSSCLGSLLGSVRSSIFRSRGIAANYTREIGVATLGIGAGYDNRKFIGAEGTVLAAADGITDENYYIFAGASGPMFRGRVSASATASWYDSGLDTAGDTFTIGSSVSYMQQVYRRLSARAAFSAYLLDNEISDADVSALNALVGLRYDF